jgi:Holliday junction DNA helicase RuvB
VPTPTLPRTVINAALFSTNERADGGGFAFAEGDGVLKRSQDEVTMNDINDVKPTSINHIVGQPSVVAQVKIALDAAQQDGRKFDHAMLVGGPGLGKTQVCQIIGEEMATDYLEYLGQSISTVADLNAVLLSATERSIVAVDEAHELPKSVQTALYLALDRKKVILQGNKKGGTPISIPIAEFSLLLATTDEYHLLAPLRDRMRLVLRFEFYTVAELTHILRHRLRALGWSVEEEFLERVAARSRGVPRLALRLAGAAHRCSRAEGCGTITMAHLERACELEQIDSLGLGPTEQAYLRIIADGDTRLNVIASRLGLPARTISQVTESFLIRAGLVVKDDQGRRQLTALGREHLRSQRTNLL